MAPSSAATPKLRRLDSSHFLTPRTTPMRSEQSEGLLRSVLRTGTKLFFRGRGAAADVDEDDFSVMESSAHQPASQNFTRDALIRAVTHVSPVPFSTWQEQLRILEEVKEYIHKTREKKPENLESLVQFLDEILKNPIQVLGYSQTEIDSSAMSLGALKEILTKIKNGRVLVDVAHKKTKGEELYSGESEESDEEIDLCDCAQCVVDRGYQDLSILKQRQFETLHGVFLTMFYQKPPEVYELLVKILNFIAQKGKSFEKIKYTCSEEEGRLFQEALEILSDVEVEKDAFVKEFEELLQKVKKENQLCLEEGDVGRFESLREQLEERFQIGLLYKLQKFVEVEFVNLFSKTVEGFIAKHPNIELVKVYQMLLEFQQGSIAKAKCQEVSTFLGKLEGLNVAIQGEEKQRLLALKTEIETKMKEETIKLDLSRLGLVIQDIDSILRRNEGAWQTMQRDIQESAEEMMQHAAENVAHVFQKEFQGALKEASQDLLDIQSVLKKCADLTANTKVTLLSKEQELFVRVMEDLGLKRKDSLNGDKETYGLIVDFLRANYKDGIMMVPRDQLESLQRYLAFILRKVEEQSGLGVQFGQKMGQVFQSTVKETASDLTKSAPIGLLHVVRALRIALKKKLSDSDKLRIQFAKDEDIDNMQMDKTIKEELKQVCTLLNSGGIGEEQKSRVQKLLARLETEVLPQNQGVLTTAMQQISDQFSRQFFTSLEDTGLLSTLQNVQEISEKLTTMSADIKSVTEDLKSVIDSVKTPLKWFMWSLIPLAFITLIGGFWLTKVYIERKYPSPA